MRLWHVKELIGSDGLLLEDSNIPVPKQGEVVIKVSYAGVNYPDVLLTEGKYQFKPTIPFTPGAEVSGYVHNFGSDVFGFKLGDPVMAFNTWGGYAEYISLPSNQIVKLSQKTNLRQAAVLAESYGTAYHALVNVAKLKEAEKVVILGATGGIGLAAVQIAKKLGAVVYAQVSTNDRGVFLHETEDVEVIIGENIGEILKKNGGSDVIVDPVGGNRSEQAFRSIRPNGRHLVIGFASGIIPALPWNLPLLKSAAIMGVYWGGFWRQYPEENLENLQVLTAWLESGDIRPRITNELPFHNAPLAIEALKNRKVYGKWLLKVSE